MRFIQAVALLALLIPIGIFGVQNRQVITVNFLSWNLSQPIALITAGGYVLGMLSGWTVLALARGTFLGASARRGNEPQSIRSLPAGPARGAEATSFASPRRPIRITMLMDASSWMTGLDRADTSHVLLAMLAGILLATVILYRLGAIGRVLRILALVVGAAIRGGFLLWERLLGWASWPLYLAIVVGLLLAGGAAGSIWPTARVLCGLAPLFMGIIACLAYMFVDLERNEVERGYKAIHNPLKGQALAMNLGRYGRRVGIPLLISAAVASIGGFALLNQGLHDTIGRDWYAVADERREPAYADFLAYALTKILGIMDVLDLFRSHHVMGAAFVREAAWPASSLLAGFKVFFTLVLLHQIFASLRQGRLLAETITDFWSPHEPIHERARHALPVYGILAIRPLLGSMRQVSSLTREQRDQLPIILETIGPAIIPALIRHLDDPHEDIRAVVAVALGHLRAVESISLLAALVRDPSDVVRQGAVEAMGTLASPSPGSGRGGKVRAITRPSRWRRRGAVIPPRDPVELAVSAMQIALADESAAVRIKAVEALGRIGSPAAALAGRLIGMLEEPDETVRCQAALALSQVGGDAEATVAALIELLDDASAPVKESAARALGMMAAAAAAAIPALVALLLDGQESVRTAAADAIARVGPLDRAATDALVEGLASPDDIVRAIRPRRSARSVRRRRTPRRRWSWRCPTTTTACDPGRWRRWARSANPPRRPSPI